MSVTSLIERRTKIEELQDKVKGLLLDYARVSARLTLVVGENLLLDRSLEMLREENARLREELRKATHVR